MRVLLAVLAMLVLATPAFAQSTATPVLPGLLVSSPCNPGQTVCFAPYSNSNPLPMTCVSGCSGAGGNVTIVNPLGRSADAASVSTALSTEDVAALKQCLTSGTPLASPTTAGASLCDAVAAVLQAAEAPLASPAVGTGVKTFSEIVPANTTSFVIDASPGVILAVRIYGINATTPVFLKTYNVAQGSVTCGSGTPKNRFSMATATTGGGSNASVGSIYGVAYSTAITGCVTGGIADNDTTNPTAANYIVEVDYN